MELKDIDISFDARKETPDGKDPDSASKTLKAYHRLLWSKPLPNGEKMKLDLVKGTLKWQEKEMWFGVDSIAVSFNHARFHLLEYVKENTPNFAEEREVFLSKTYTIGGSIIFPMVRWSMNQARGCSVKICDRWDLTLECIRRFYAGEPTPLDKAFAKSADFFRLFVDFKGYVDFFLLQDCVDENYNVKFWLDTPFFASLPMPRSLKEYNSWIQTQFDFVDRRGQRIAEYCCYKG